MRGPTSGTSNSTARCDRRREHHDRRTPDIADFITARLDDEEAVARRALSKPSRPWTTRNLGRHDESAILLDTGERTAFGLPLGPAFASTHGSNAAHVALHVARQDPVATLARVEALRALVARCQQHIDFGNSPKAPGGPVVTPGVLIGNAAAELLRHVAAIWRHHPDYRQEWEA